MAWDHGEGQEEAPWETETVYVKLKGLSWIY